MAETKRKGDLGEAMVMADALRRGYKVAIPIGEDWRYDLIILRDGKLERVQCKFTVSNGDFVEVHCRSSNNWSTFKYTSEDVDWMAVYDQTTDKCYYIPSNLLGTGRTMISLRLTPTKNNQKVGVLWASSFTTW